MRKIHGPFIVPKMGREAGYGRKKAKADSGKKAYWC